MKKIIFKPRSRGLRQAISIALPGAMGLICGAALANEANQPIHIELAPTAVTANPLDNAFDELVAPVSVLNGRELTYQRQSTLGETLNGTPGVHSSYFGPNASRPVIRGLDGDRIRLMQNGIGMLDLSSLSQDHAVPLNPLVIEQIDVVRGPAALQYGGSAVGGAVNSIDNRIPREAVNGISGRAEASIGGAAHARNAAALVEAGNGTLALHADLYTSESDDLEIPGFARSARQRAADPQPTESRHRLLNSAAEGDGGALGAALTFDRGYAGISYSEFNANYGTVAEPEVTIDMNSARIDAAGELRDMAGPVSRIKARVTQVDYEHQELEGGEVGTTFTNRGWEGSLEATHAKLGLLNGVIGLQWHRSDFNAIGDEALIPKTSTDSEALYAYEELPFSLLAHDSKFSFGVRTEHAKVESAGGGPDDANSPGTPRFGQPDRRTFTPLSGSLGLLVHLDKAWSVTGNLSHTERAPAYYELYSNGPHVATGQFELGDSTLDTEKSNGLDVQLRWRNGPNHIALTGFYTRFQNYITQFLTGVNRDSDGLINVNGELPEAQIQAVPAVFKGIELDSLWRAYEGVGTLDIKLKGDYVRATDTRSDRPLPRISPLRLGFGLDYSFARFGARLDVTRTFEQDRVAANELPTDGYTMVNAIVSYHLPSAAHVDVFIKATNLLDQEAREHTSVLKDIAPLGGRAVMLGLRGEF